MNRLRWLGRKASERGEYASKEDFASVFESERKGLQRLSLLLTANKEAAKQCLSRAFLECIASSAVSKEWVLSWIRRMVIRNAISLVIDHRSQPFVSENDVADEGPIAFSLDESLGSLEESGWILDLPELDRFVFVICVLERYSKYDCALLLGRSLRDVSEARKRGGDQVGQVDEHSNASEYFAIG